MSRTDALLDAEALAADLRRLGVAEGDVIYVRARVSAIGRLAPPARRTLIEGFRTALGQQGTLVVPAFTGANYRWSRAKARFAADAPSNAGVLARAVLEQPDHVRSSHPTHSFAALGPAAGAVLAGHGPDRPAFFPVGRLIERDAKMILIGCNEESPGFSTVHFVQEELGLSQRHWTRLMIEARYEKDGREVLWRPREDPGCSLGFHKLYPQYARAGNLTVGRVGAAEALLVRAAQAYAAEKALLSRDPLAAICDRPDCVSCRLLRGYNLRSVPAAALRIGLKALRRA